MTTYETIEVKCKSCGEEYFANILMSFSTASDSRIENAEICPKCGKTDYELIKRGSPLIWNLFLS